ncbi:MAG TPA: arginine--tRNA ligase [Alphaproteobacteria bacterium]|nr:arginine--tRNA ligase [Alphaproteobacteria bacterium]
MNIYKEFSVVVRAIVQDLVAAGSLPAGLDLGRVIVEAPREVAHGDLATNAAMVLSKPAGMKPRDLAELLVPRLVEHADIVSADIACPGFINMRLTDGFWRERLKDVLRAGAAYGESDEGKGRRVNVEYVSANPTGPLTAGHARGAVVGDAIAGLMAKTGHEVCREYYINDAGAQVDVLARSTFLRYREALGEEIAEIPPGFYPGDYLKAVGKALAERDGAKWRDLPEAEWLPDVRAFAVAAMMEAIRSDLGELGIQMDRFSSERELVEAGAVTRALETLENRGLLYRGVLEPPKGKQLDDWEPREQLLFRSTQFGDDVDRPIQKADGSFTYFANDIAYHFDKYSRGYPTLIDVVGADHGGWVKRITAAVTAVTEGKAEIDIKLCQLVNLLQDGQPVKMSKRSGTFVTLRDIIDEVGRGVVRFIMLTRRNDQTLDFDFAKVTEQSKDNPVFYVQYAHARCRSVLRAAVEQYSAAILASESLLTADLNRMDSPEEMELIRRMASFPAVVTGAALAHEPHRIAFYLYDLAASFHQLWTRGKDNATLRFLLPDDRSLTIARLALVQAVATVIASGLRVIGVEPAEELRS